MMCSTCNGSGRMPNEERGRVGINLAPVDVRAHEFGTRIGGRTQGKSIAQAAMAGMAIMAGGTVLTRDEKGGLVLVRLVNGEPVMTPARNGSDITFTSLDEMSRPPEPSMTEASAKAFLRDLASDMQRATTAHVRRQGRRLAKALATLGLSR